MAPAKLRSGASTARRSEAKDVERRGQTERPRVLRVGVVVSGRVIDEKLIRPEADVSVGGSERNDFVLTEECLPSRFKIFEHRGGIYHLNVVDSMEGRVSFNGGFDDISSLRQKGRMKSVGGHHRLELSQEARGKVVIGDTTLLFQMVQRPATAPLPQLPASVRGGWVKSIDWFFGALLIASFVAQFAFVTWLVYRDWPIQPSFDGHADVRVFDTPPSQVQIDEQLRRAMEHPLDSAEETAPQVMDVLTDGVQEPLTPSRTHRPATPSSSSGATDPGANDRLRAALDQSAREALGRINILGWNDPNASGVVADVLNGGGVQVDQDRLLAEINGLRMAQRGEETTFRRPVDGREHTGEAPSGRFAVRSDPADQGIATGTVTERHIPARSGTGTVTITSTSQGDLDPRTVRRIVASNMGGIASCYERPLQRDHSLAGRVTINFTIAEGGRVTRARAVQNTVAPEVGSCIETRIRAIHFPSPQGGPATFQFPFIFQPAAQ